MKKKKLLIFLMTLSLVVVLGCGTRKRELITKKVYLTNHSFDEHDSVYFQVFINEKHVIGTPYKNKYISHHWDDFIVHIPKDSFHLKILIDGSNYQLEKDTLIKVEEEESLFIEYDFKPSHKYNNPEIYQRWDGKSDMKQFTDSLYKNNLIDKSYLLDTLPSEKYIHISTNVVKEEIE